MRSEEEIANTLELFGFDDACSTNYYWTMINSNNKKFDIIVIYESGKLHYHIELKEGYSVDEIVLEELTAALDLTKKIVDYLSE